MVFGETADTLPRHKKGELLSLHGKATQSVWMDKSGEQRSQLSVNVQSVVSARTARPGGNMTAKAREKDDDSGNPVVKTGVYAFDEELSF